jgi:RNA polymerase sigma factor (sigma-70 family)
MAAVVFSGLTADLRRLASLSDASGLTDCQLVERYRAARDEAAFHALLRRHGPMVFGVCRRLLRQPQDAEDAFQATFLVLVKKVDTIRPPGQVGNWLYGVACRTALHARAVIVRRRAREAQVKHMAAPPTVAEPAWDDLRDLLDRELLQLPDKYRSAMVLCDLEGRPRAAAALQLGIPEGTLSSRLNTGRKLLASRLTCRGVTVTGAVLTAILSGNVATAQVPPALAAATRQAAAAFSLGQSVGAPSGNAASLAGAVLKGLGWARVQALAATSLVAALFTVGVVVLASHGSGSDGASAGPAPPALPATKGALEPQGAAGPTTARRARLVQANSARRHQRANRHEDDGQNNQQEGNFQHEGGEGRGQDHDREN